MWLIKFVDGAKPGKKLKLQGQNERGINRLLLEMDVQNEIHFYTVFIIYLNFVLD